ncbi:MAG TPA: PKD domain-containing protein, partial [Bacteroidia bacterium]|nr:PKD domain-containing protein [Bacteroidia bacterium]
PPGTSTTASPTYTYSVAGSYTATLISTSANGCTDTIKVPVVVNPNPTGTFTVPPVCLGTASVFTLTTTNMAGGTYAWAFGDAPTNGTSAVQNPTYTYGTTGTFNVSVVLTTSAGCTGNATGTALVNPIPVPNFTAPPVCSDQAMVFTNTSIPATGATYAWNFGDGSTSSSASPTHQYAACGTYNVMLTVTSGTNCVHDTTITVTINPVPVPNFTATTECPGFATTFTDKSTISCGGTITGWAWNFGDGSGTSTVQNPTYTYKASGIYQVSLTVTSNNGCDSTIKLPVTVYPIPVPGFTATAPCQGVATNFTDTSKVAGGIITGWSWRFGDPANGTAGTQNPSYTYAAAGAYNVTLVVTSSNGCIDSVTEQVLVHPNPVPAFVSDTAFCTPKCITDTDLSTVSPIPPPASNINAWAWNFGDGSPDSISDLAQPNHCYTKPGTYTVSLTVTTNFGCTATLVKPNYVTAWPVPVAKFAANPNPTVLVDNPTVVFTDQSTGNPVSWSWFNFGDGKDSLETTENTTHTYTDTGTFVVYLAIKNKFGCVDTTDVPVIVQPVWTFYVPNAFTPNGDGINDGFIGKGVGILSYEMWIFDRWGMQLYHCTSMSQPWDGTVQGGSGQKCEEDTYVWLIQIVDVFHDSHRYVGRVSIIK